MKIQTAFLILILPCLAIAENQELKTLQYRIHIATQFNNPKSPPEGLDPFSDEAKQYRSASSFETLEEYIAYALDIEITPKNGKFIYFDGETICAAMTELDHEKFRAMISTKGYPAPQEKEAKIRAFLKQDQLKSTKPRKADHEE